MLQRLWCKVGHRSEIWVSISLASPSALDSPAFGLMILAWALADVSRYQLYVWRTLGRVPPRWLTWLRYTDFVPQYPLVVLAETWFVGRCWLSRENEAWLLASC